MTASCPAIDVVRGDITTLRVDAIVNAANAALAGGGGVDGAIHRAAGPELHAACRAIPMVAPFVRCPTGEARITPGFALPARHIVHTVGPVWEGGGEDEAELLASCYFACLELAVEHRLASLAFPAISCGVYGYPADEAVRIAVASVRAWREALPARVVFCVFDAQMELRYRRALGDAPA